MWNVPVFDINFKNKSFITFFIITFYNPFTKFRNIFNLFKVIYKQLGWHCPTRQVIHIPKCKIWWFIIFIIIFHMFSITFAYLLIQWDILPLISCLTINSISILFNNSNFTSVFFKAACQAHPGAERNFAGSKIFETRHSIVLKNISQLYCIAFEIDIKTLRYYSSKRSIEILCKFFLYACNLSL